MSDLGLFSFDEFAVFGDLQMHKEIVGSRCRADQFVEFELRDQLLSILSVLNDKEHDQRHRFSGG